MFCSCCTCVCLKREKEKQLENVKKKSVTCRNSNEPFIYFFFKLAEWVKKRNSKNADKNKWREKVKHTNRYTDK